MTDLPGGEGPRGPLPPHERAWRHPSELAAPPLEATTRGGRVLIVSTATVSLLLVGVLALLMTPDRARNAEDDEAIATDFVTFVPAAGSPGAGTETSPSRVGDASPQTSVATSVVAPGGRTATTPAITSGFGNVEPAPSATVSVPSVSITIAGAIVVTPVGDGLAVTTESAVAGAGGSITAVLPSGERVVADVVVAADGVVFVTVSETNDGIALADDVSSTEVLYLSIGGTTTPVDSRALAAMVIPEATPVVDADGKLVGLCTYGTGGIEVVPVGTLPEVPTTTVLATEPSESSEPAPASSPPPSVATTSPAGAPVSDPDESSTVPSTADESTSTSTSTSLPGR